MTTLRTTWAVLLLAGAALAPPAAADTLGFDQRPRGGQANVVVAAQLNPTYGLVPSLEFPLSAREHLDLDFALRTDPRKFMDYAVFDLTMNFLGQTGAFLPINLMPFMGLGMGMNVVPREFKAYATVPMGVRYGLAHGPLALGAEAGYVHQVGTFNTAGPAAGATRGIDTSRWHYEADLRLGKLVLAGFYDQGALIAGPGGRLGFAF